MYATRMTASDIESHMRELSDIEISNSTVSQITNKISQSWKNEWQERPPKKGYAIFFMDAPHYHARNKGQIVKRAVYIGLGIEEHKDVLGMHAEQNEHVSISW